MKGLVWKSSKAGDLVKRFCAVVYSTTKGCMSLDQYRRFVRCVVDPELLGAAEPDLVPKVVSQALSPKYDINGSVEVQAAAKAFIDKMGALLARKRASV